MTREENVKNLLTELIEMIDNGSQRDLDRADEISKTIIKALSQEPCEDIAQERYKDLCEYFGGAKDILKSREDFKAWLGRVKWHIHKAEELYEKYEYKKEPCDDAIDRAEAMTEIMMFAGNVKPDEEDIYIKVSDAVQLLRELPSVTQKSGKWIETEYHRWRCSVCREKGMSEWDNIHDVRTNFCPDCGADMRGAE